MMQLQFTGLHRNACTSFLYLGPPVSFLHLPHLRGTVQVNSLLSHCIGS